MRRQPGVTAWLAALTGFVVLAVLVTCGSVAPLDAAISGWASAFGLAHPGWVAAQRAIIHAGDTVPVPQWTHDARHHRRWAGAVAAWWARLVHWPSDVIGGWLLPIGTVPLVYLAITASAATSAATSAARSA
jgi:hypothetical protein